MMARIMESFSNRHEFVLKTDNARLCDFVTLILISQGFVTLLVGARSQL